MTTEGVIAAVIMVGIGLVWLALPLLRRKSSLNAGELVNQKERAALLTTYERTLASIRDLDDDYLTGKLSESDYQSERSQFTEQGVAVLQALEKRGVKAPPKSLKVDRIKKPVPTNSVDPDEQLDDAIEQAIAAYIESTN